MSATSIPKGAVARPSGSKAGSDLLGFVTWFGFSDADVPLRTLKEQWTVAGLPREVLPEETKALDSFKRACASLEGRKRITIDSNLEIQEVHSDLVINDEKACIYQVAFVIADAKEREGRYPRACKFIFDKDKQKVNMTTQGEEGITRRAVAPLAEHVMDAYHEGLTRVAGAKVRELIRNYLRTHYAEEPTYDKKGNRTGLKVRYGLGGENMADGGSPIYFIPAKELAGLKKLQEFVYGLKARQPRYAKDKRPYGYLNYLEIADTKGHRDMVREHLNANLTHAISAMVAEIDMELHKTQSGQRKQSFREDKKSNMFRDIGDMIRRAKEYEDILKSETVKIESQLESLKARVDKI